MSDADTARLLARNIRQRARLVADHADPEWLAGLHLPVLVELDYYLEDVATALDRARNRTEDNDDATSQ